MESNQKYNPGSNLSGSPGLVSGSSTETLEFGVMMQQKVVIEKKHNQASFPSTKRCLIGKLDNHHQRLSKNSRLQTPRFCTKVDMRQCSLIWDNANRKVKKTIAKSGSFFQNSLWKLGTPRGGRIVRDQYRLVKADTSVHQISNTSVMKMVPVILTHKGQMTGILRTSEHRLLLLYKPRHRETA